MRISNIINSSVFIMSCIAKVSADEAMDRHNKSHESNKEKYEYHTDVRNKIVTIYRDAMATWREGNVDYAEWIINKIEPNVIHKNYSKPKRVASSYDYKKTYTIVNDKIEEFAQIMDYMYWFEGTISESETEVWKEIAQIYRAIEYSTTEIYYNGFEKTFEHDTKNIEAVTKKFYDFSIKESTVYTNSFMNPRY